MTLHILFEVKRNILGHRKDYWGPLEALEQVAPESSEIVRSVQNLPNIRYVTTDIFPFRLLGLISQLIIFLGFRQK